MRKEILIWKHESGDSIWMRFLELFKTAPVSDEDFRHLINCSSENVGRHKPSHFDPVRQCLNNIHYKDKYEHQKNINSVDSQFLDGQRINFKNFLKRLEICPMSESTFKKIIESPNTTNDYVSDKQNHIKESEWIMEIANDLHRQNKYKSEPTTFKDYITGDLLDYDLEKNVSESKKDTPEERLKRLKNAPKLVEKIEITTVGYKRNPDVINEVLLRAKGICERCNKTAPFIRKKDNSPYLEVHHKIMLSQGGEDTVENAVALCPNCHRELHYG